jgi:hypothetical protein
MRKKRNFYDSVFELHNNATRSANRNNPITQSMCLKCSQISFFFPSLYRTAIFLASFYCSLFLPEPTMESSASNPRTKEPKKKSEPFRANLFYTCTQFSTSFHQKKSEKLITKLQISFLCME